jgi:hypothetical protein
VRFKDFISEAPKVHANERVQLINDLLRETDSNFKLKLEPHMLDEAMAEAIHIAGRIVRGADEHEIMVAIESLRDAMKNTRKAIMPFPTWSKNLNEAGVWIDNVTVGKVMAHLQAEQINIMSSAFFLSNLHELLIAINGLCRLYDGRPGLGDRMGTTESERAFLRAGFKKLGIIE